MCSKFSKNLPKVMKKNLTDHFEITIYYQIHQKPVKKGSGSDIPKSLSKYADKSITKKKKNLFKTTAKLFHQKR